MKLKEPKKYNGYSTIKIEWDSEVCLNGVKLVEHKSDEVCLFKLHADHINTILEIEEVILGHLGEEKYADLFQSSVSVTKRWGQVFKCASSLINSQAGGVHDIVVSINKLKVYPSHVKLCWKCVKFSEPKVGECFIELFDEEEGEVDDEDNGPEPDPDLLDTIKRELLARIEKARETYMNRFDLLAADVCSINEIGNIAAFEAIEECLVAL